MKLPNAVYITNNIRAFKRHFNKNQFFTTRDKLLAAVEFFDYINSYLVVVLDVSIEEDIKIYEGN